MIPLLKFLVRGIATILVLPIIGVIGCSLAFIFWKEGFISLTEITYRLIWRDSHKIQIYDSKTVLYF
jgi:hypothetical protein